MSNLGPGESEKRIIIVRTKDTGAIRIGCGLYPVKLSWVL